MPAASSERVSPSKSTAPRDPNHHDLNHQNLNDRALDHYERACDQAIAMCDGNLRSTIKALIMANEYLETELQESRTRELRGTAFGPGGLSQAGSGDAA